MEKLVLYSFTGDQYVESYDPVCIKAIRLLNFLQIDYDLKIVSLSDNISKVEKSINVVPTFSYKNKIYFLWKEVAPLIEGLSKTDKLQGFHLTPSESAQQTIIEQWVYSALEQTASYFIHEVKENHEQFSKNIAKLFDNEKIVRVLEQYNQMNKDFLVGTIFARFEYDDAVERLVGQLTALNQLLKDHRFLIKDEITYTDIAVFSYVHALFHPFIKETHKLAPQFPKLIRWANLIDRMTSNDYTRKFSFSDEILNSKPA